MFHHLQKTPEFVVINTPAKFNQKHCIVGFFLFFVAAWLLTTYATRILEFITLFFLRAKGYI